MRPIDGEVPQIDWPVIEIGEHKMVVKWGLRMRWLCSSRGVSLTSAANDPRFFDLTLQWFAAAVSQHFTSRGQQAPTAEYWVNELEKLGPVEANEKIAEIGKKILDAFSKARAAETAAAVPTDPAAANQSATLN